MSNQLLELYEETVSKSRDQALRDFEAATECNDHEHLAYLASDQAAADAWSRLLGQPVSVDEWRGFTGRLGLVGYARSRREPSVEPLHAFIRRHVGTAPDPDLGVPLDGVIYPVIWAKLVEAVSVGIAIARAQQEPS